MEHLTLSDIARRLESHEETIIFRLIDRAQYAANAMVYERGKSGFRDAVQVSLLELVLKVQERVDRRFDGLCPPEERLFVKCTPQPRKVIADDRGILIEDCNVVDLTGDILKGYLALIPRMCASGDDGRHGPCVEHDIHALQAISRRVHFGSLHAAEAKYNEDPESFARLVAEIDRDGLYKKLTRKNVEDAIIGRIREKTESTQASVNKTIRRVIDPGVVVDFYRECIIPLTKMGQVLYLLNRKDPHDSNAI